MHKLLSYGVNGSIFNIITSFQQEHALKVVLMVSLMLDCLGGPVLGHTLVLAFINGLLDDTLLTSGRYADDTLLMGGRYADDTLLMGGRCADDTFSMGGRYADDTTVYSNSNGSAHVEKAEMAELEHDL